MRKSLQEIPYRTVDPVVEFKLEIKKVRVEKMSVPAAKLVMRAIIVAIHKPSCVYDVISL